MGGGGHALLLSSAAGRRRLDGPGRAASEGHRRAASQRNMGKPCESVEEQISVVKSKGKEAFAKGDYVDAAYSYMLAATLFANRSLRWPRLREGERALSDAQHCKTLRPRWAKAWYREGMALSFLKEHKGAVYAFEEALKLDRANHDIKKALREAMESTKNAACLGEQDPQVAACVRSD
ncbi:uncharacterized protein [Miscanthus floridulus]|uniref:uncharacterized protein n=1 Tax=Miscanthus floridulus TaxID=154761 RepID=UPI00345A89CD